MERAKTNVLIGLTSFAALIVLIGPFVGAISATDMALMTTAIGIMGATYFSRVSPKKEEVSPLITLLFLGFAGLSTSAAGIFTYDGILQVILFGLIFIILVVMEIGTWFYTAVYEIDDIPPIVNSVFPEEVLRDHDNIDDFQDSSEDLNQKR